MQNSHSPESIPMQLGRTQYVQQEGHGRICRLSQSASVVTDAAHETTRRQIAAGIRVREIQDSPASRFQYIPSRS